MASANIAPAQDPRPSHTGDLFSETNYFRQIQEQGVRFACFNATAAALADAGKVAIVSRADVSRNQNGLLVSIWKRSIP
jgi:hypothetical protein